MSGLDRIGAGRRPFAEGIPFVRALVEAMPERTLWGTDWPHPNVRGDMPDDGELCDAFFLACPDDEARRHAGAQPGAAVRISLTPAPRARPGRVATTLFDSKGDKHVEETILRRPAGLAVTGAARAEAPVRLIIAFPPGGPVDLVGRVLAEQLGKELKQQVIVENKAGANGNIAASYVAKAPGDGSVLFLTSVGAVSISPALYKDLPYDPARDFAPVSRVVNNATVFVVNPANLAVDAADFVKRSQADSQPVAVGSSGIGSIPHLTLEMFADASRAKVMHVPYKGAAPVINDVMGNRWRASSATCRA